MKKLFFALAALCGLLAIGCPDPGTSPTPVDPATNFTGLTADGSPTQTTTKLSLSFNQDIPGLAAGDITLGGSTGATAESLNKTGPGTYELTLSGIRDSGAVTVSVSKTGYNITGGPKQVTVYHNSGGTLTQAAFNTLSANGSATETTTNLSLTFDKDITDLAAGNITLGGSTGAKAGTLTRTAAGKYDLTLRGINQTGPVTVTVAKSGYNITGSPRQVTVYYNGQALTQAAFTNLTANGSATETTTKLSLTFDKDITGLTAGDIDLEPGTTGAEKGELTKTSTATGKYELTLSGITQGGTVTVTIVKSGYEFSGGAKQVAVYYSSAGDTPATFTGLTANGSATETTTKLSLTFDKDITGLTAGDIDLEPGTTGAEKGELTKTPTATGVYELAIRNITQGGTVTVTVTKQGYNITDRTKTVTVNYYGSTGDTPATFTNLTANGSATETTTKLSLTFDKDISGLTAGDIDLEPGTTGAEKGELTKTPTATGAYELAISNITQGGAVTVTVAKSGYNITGSPKQVTVYYAISAAFSSLTADGSATQTTTKLSLTFNKDITGLAVEDITLQPGTTEAKAETLTRIGTGAYDLTLSGITQGGEISLSVSKAGYAISGGPKTAQVFYYNPGDTSLTITFAQIADAAPSIDTDIILHRLSNNGQTTATLTVDNPDQYDIDSISWRVQNTDVTGTGASFTLSAANTAYNQIAKHFVTVTVMKDGVPYTKTVTFKVEL